MADVIRRAIIEIETRQKRSRLEAPGADASTQGFKAEAEAATKAEKATEQASAATKRHAEVVRSSAYTIVKDFREAGEGAFRMARGLTLLSASGSDDLKKLVQQVAIAQGAFDVFAGGFKLLTNVSRVFGPVGAAVAGVTALIGAGALAWRGWEKSAVDAAAAAIKEQEKLIEKQNQLRSLQAADRAEGRRSRFENVERGTQAEFDRIQLARSQATIERIEVNRQQGQLFRDAAFGGKFGGGIPNLGDLLEKDRPLAGRVLGLEKEQRDLLREERDLLHKERDFQKSAAETQKEFIGEIVRQGAQGASFGAGGGLLGAFATLPIAATGRGFHQDITQRADANAERITRATDKIADAIENLAGRIRFLEHGLSDSR